MWIAYLTSTANKYAHPHLKKMVLHWGNDDDGDQPENQELDEKVQIENMYYEAEGIFQ